jgi:hypothetical protein
MDLQTCKTCLETKPITEFFKHPASKFGRRKTCKSCSYNKIDARAKRLKMHYGITLQEYNEMFNRQNGCCAICKTHQSDLTVSLAVDHCHGTKKVRGLLCYNCNSGLGRFKDNISFLQEAINYLES